MHTSRYEIILKVAETKSFTRTAEYFQYTQSGVSQMVRAIEEELGVTLFRRTSKGVLLSEEAEFLLPSIREIVTGQRQLTEQLGELRNLHAGIIRLSSYISVSCHWLPLCIRKFNSIYPNVKFEYFQEDDAQMIEWLQKGIIDIAFMSNPKKRDLNYQELFEDPFLLVLPEDYPDNKKESMTLVATENEDYISLEIGYGHYYKEMFQQANINPRIQYRMIDDSTIISMVEKGFGISILPELVTYRTPFHVKFKKVEPYICRHIGMVTRKSDQLSWALKKFIEFTQTMPGNVLTDEKESFVTQY